MNKLKIKMIIAAALIIGTTNLALAKKTTKSKTQSKESTQDSQEIKEAIVVENNEYGNVYIDLVDLGHPVNLPITLNVSILCKDRSNNAIKEKPKRESVIRDLKVCSYEGVEQDKEAGIVTLIYRLQSETFDPNDETCNEGFERDISLKDLCYKWTLPRMGQ